MNLLTCPDCSSPNVTLTYAQQVMVNDLEHYCHSVKPQDSDSPSQCLTCGWVGQHRDLKGYEENE